MDRQQEYEVKSKIYNYINSRINQYLDIYFKKYCNNIGFLLYYPLIFIENKFRSVLPGFHKIVVPDRFTINWFIKEMLKRNYQKNLCFMYNEDAFFEFARIYPRIHNMYNDFEKNSNIMLMRTVAKVSITMLGDNIFEVREPEISDDYLKDNIYYFGLDDTEARKNELEIITKPDNYLLKKYNFFNDFIEIKIKALKSKEKRIKDLINDVDIELYNLCVERVSIDINKLGGDIKSEIISSSSELKKIIGFFYYISIVTNYKCALFDLLGEDILKHLVVRYDYYKLINRIFEVTQISKTVIKGYLKYFNYVSDEGGGLNEFPIVIYNRKVIFIPSSFMLNDYQFSIVNAHYHKDIKIINRDDTVSQSIVDDIINKASKYTNIVCASNKNYAVSGYSFKGKELKSDIDAAIYDKLTNTLLIIECKWKENVYPLNEDFIKIEKGVNQIYNEQLDKHKAFLELSEKNIDFVFDNNPDVISRKCFPKVFYIFVDKRIQFHDEKRHALSVFVLLHMFEEFSDKKILFLEKIISEIESLRTEVDYLC